MNIGWVDVGLVRSRNTAKERWGAGVETHFQEIS